MTESLDFGNSARIRDAKRCLFRHVNQAIDEIGMDVACKASGARRQDMRDALSDREGRKLPVEWIWSIALVSPEPVRAEIAKCLLEALQYGIAPLKPLTLEQKYERLKYRVATRFGQAGVELVEENER
jgi:hypothetical protein